ncbi:MAG: aromatic ring-hydroxylating dioxygenase subunit alpha [Rhodovibrionaceae bacterium]
MLSREENERVTRVGADTPGGELLRRYWHVVGAASEMENCWTKRVRLLGEDLVLYKNRQGELGLIEERCPHRGASLAYGIPTKDGIRCPYHGWQFDGQGGCIEQPNEPEGSKLKDKIKTPAYPVETLGGLVFAYLGPDPAPLLPRFDGFLADDAIRMVGQAMIPCNWLQIMENSLDPVHTEWLHGQFHEFIMEEEGAKFTISRKHLKIAFDEFEYGMIKRRLLEGQSEDCDDWQVGHPVVFPNILSVGSGGGKGLWRSYAFQIRVPMDDTHTMHYWYNAYLPPDGTDVPERLLTEVPLYDVPYTDETGEYIVDMIDAQDIMAWVFQGEIADRSRENLGSTDRGVASFRRMLQREIKKVEQGEEPIGVIRDAAKNQRIDLPLEKDKEHFRDGFASLLARTQARYSPIAVDLLDLFAPGDDKSDMRSLQYAGSLHARG